MNDDKIENTGNTISSDAYNNTTFELIGIHDNCYED